jgi:hypothetical protein
MLNCVQTLLPRTEKNMLWTNEVICVLYCIYLDHFFMSLKMVQEPKFKKFKNSTYIQIERDLKIFHNELLPCTLCLLKALVNSIVSAFKRTIKLSKKCCEDCVEEEIGEIVSRFIILRYRVSINYEDSLLQWYSMGNVLIFSIFNLRYMIWCQ